MQKELAMIDYEKMMTHVKSHPFPLVFRPQSAVLTSMDFHHPDSDFDLRGVLPLQTVLSLDEGKQVRTDSDLMMA